MITKFDDFINEEFLNEEFQDRPMPMKALASVLMKGSKLTRKGWVGDKYIVMPKWSNKPRIYVNGEATDEKLTAADMRSTDWTLYKK